VNEAATLELEGVSLHASSTGALRLRSDAHALGLIGDWGPLFQALVGQAKLGGGSARLLGCELELALASGVVGFAACDPALPTRFNATQYLEHAARLSHGSATRAAREAQAALARYGLGELARRRLSELLPHQVRALGIAQATLTLPPLVCLEEPLRGLDAASADYVARLCAEAGSRARLIVSAAKLETIGPGRALLDQCDELLWLEGETLVARGTPSELLAPGDRYLLTVTGSSLSEFSLALQNAGCQLREPGEAGEYVVTLPPGESTDLLLDSALALGLVVLELEPLLGAH